MENLYINLKRVGQGIIILVALFLFGNSALAYTDNFIDDLGAGDTFETVNYGNYSFDNYDDWLALTSVSLEPELTPSIYTTYEAAYVDDESILFSPFLATSSPFVLYIPEGYNIVLERSAYPNGLDINLCGSDLIDCFFIKHLDWLPQPVPQPVCPAGATGALCQIGGAVVTGSTGVLSNIISNYFPTLIVFSIIIWFVLFFATDPFAYLRSKKKK